MNTPLDIIAGYGVSTTSYIRAIQELNAPGRLFNSQLKYEQEIAKIVGSDHPPSFSSFNEARICFLYIVQETIRSSLVGIPDMDSIWVDSQQKTKRLIEKQPWIVKEYDNSESANSSRGTLSKKDRAERLYKEMNTGDNDRSSIIEAMVSEIGLSKAGATTYFHNFKKQFGYSGPESKQKKRTKIDRPVSKPPKQKIAKGPTKAQIAREVYQSMIGEPKEKIIAEIVARAGTTPAGANTYYCSCKKEFESGEHTEAD